MIQPAQILTESGAVQGVAQQLTTISQLLGKMGRNSSGRGDSHIGEIGCIEEQLLCVTQDVRSLSRRGTLLPVTARGFTKAIRTLAQSIRRAAGLHTILRLTESVLPDDATAEQLYRIVQEAVHNIIQHAKASSLRVTFKTEGKSFLLVVRDDGIGTSAEARSVGMGIQRMISRARTIGAQLEVRSVPGCGTAVRCVVPLKNGD